MGPLIALHYKLFRNRFLKLTFLDEFKLSVASIVGLFFIAWLYVAAWRLFSYLNDVAVIGPLLVNKLVALIFLASFSMVIFSGLINSQSTIFANQDLLWLITTPLSIKKIFFQKTCATVFYSSWMVCIALFPFLAAFGQVKNAPLLFYFGSVLLLIPFFVFATLIGMTISLLMVRFFPSRKIRDFTVFFGVLLVTGGYILFRFIEPERLVRPDGLNTIAQYLSYLDTPTAIYLPSWWLTAGISSLLTHHMHDLLLFTALLFCSAALVMAVLISFSQQLYFVGWAEGQTYNKQDTHKRHNFLKRSVFGTLLAKDTRIFFRDTKQWSQLLILAAIVMVYLFSLYKLPLDTMYLQNLVAYANIALIGFILAAVALRLVFPSISVEGKSRWLLFSAPVSITKFFWSKLVFGSIPVIAMALLLTLASNYILKADAEIFMMTFTIILVMAVGLSILALGFGSMFPRFDVSNIAEIESSSGGIFFIITSFFYLGATMSLVAIPVQSFYRSKFSAELFPLKQLYWFFIVLFVLNLFIFIVPVLLGLKNLKNIEN